MQNKYTAHFCAGGVVGYVTPLGGWEFLILKQAVNQGVQWTFPKGHIDPGETALAAAYREVKEETGLQTIQLICPIGVQNYRYQHDTEPHQKQVRWFFFKSLCKQTDLQESEGFVDARWGGYKSIRQQLTYDSLKQIFDRAYQASGAQL